MISAVVRILFVLIYCIFFDLNIIATVEVICFLLNSKNGVLCD